MYGLSCYKTFNNWYNTLSNDLNQVRCKSYNRFLDYSKIPKLQEDDLEEQYIRGSGPGGQATNKTSNAVLLKHKPTGLVVKCHETRSLFHNRKIAREILLKKLDNLINGKDSLESQEEHLLKRDLIKKKQKRKKLADLKKSFEERENLNK
ncbi:putative peptide chain release factor C12orf65-like protein, mitochondrial [Habropoda laboriosa]|uniref:Putative peptide chain release factor C12orf65-like protein, mitochondrial n=2 Tax=Habropoda laboriosa TaxID=597456 RepID=A0A0L7QVI0_9HYME|nr:putative peptide chain release factor C12orf65-like protein, mitochondrial [Habropoda laboriosa]